MPNEYPEIAALERALVDHDLTLSVGVSDHRLDPRSYRRIHLATRGAETFSLPVDDEYGDATAANQPLLLHLVLAECEVYEDAVDLESWAKETGFDATEPWVVDLYMELGAAVAAVRELVGTDVKPLSSFDVGMNAGAAQALRARSDGPLPEER